MVIVPSALPVLCVPVGQPGLIRFGKWENHIQFLVLLMADVAALVAYN